MKSTKRSVSALHNDVNRSQPNSTVTLCNRDNGPLLQKRKMSYRDTDKLDPQPVSDSQIRLISKSKSAPFFSVQTTYHSIFQLSIKQDFLKLRAIK